jgi:hypothetical protein
METDLSISERIIHLKAFGILGFHTPSQGIPHQEQGITKKKA